MSCGCSTYINGQYDQSKTNFGTCIVIDSELVKELKEKVICEFLNLLSQFEKGHNTNYEFILQEISLINLLDEGKISLQSALFYLEFYNNNEFTVKWIIS